MRWRMSSPRSIGPAEPEVAIRHSGYACCEPRAPTRKRSDDMPMTTTAAAGAGIYTDRHPSVVRDPEVRGSAGRWILAARPPDDPQCSRTRSHVAHDRSPGELLRATLAAVAPGTELRDGLERILRGRTG